MMKSANALRSVRLRQASARNLFFCGVATLDVVLVKYMLSNQVRRSDQIVSIIAGKTLLAALPAFTRIHANQLPRFQRNGHDGAIAYVRAPPLARCREEFRADLEIRMIHNSFCFDSLRSDVKVA